MYILGIHKAHTNTYTYNNNNRYHYRFLACNSNNNNNRHSETDLFGDKRENSQHDKCSMYQKSYRMNYDYDLNLENMKKRNCRLGFCVRPSKWKDIKLNKYTYIWICTNVQSRRRAQPPAHSNKNKSALFAQWNFGTCLMCKCQIASNGIFNLSVVCRRHRRRCCALHFAWQTHIHSRGCVRYKHK